jgi:hypothetical protein
MLLPSSKRVTPQRPLFFDYYIAKNQNKPGKKNKALKMSTTKPFSQWTVIALREFLKERGVRSSGFKPQLVYRGRQCSFYYAEATNTAI